MGGSIDEDNEKTNEQLIEEKIATLSAKERKMLLELKHDAVEIFDDFETLVKKLSKGLVLFAIDIIFNAPGLILLLLVIGLLWILCADGFILFLDASFFIVKGILVLINDVDSAINSATGGISSGLSFALGHITGGSVHIPSIPRLTPPEVLGPWFKAAMVLARVCQDMDTWQKVIAVLIPRVAHNFFPGFCSFKRFIYPVGWLYTMLQFLFSWATYDPTPFPGGNCRPATDSYACMWIRMGLPIVYLGVPSVPVYYAVKDLGPAAWVALKMVLYFPSLIASLGSLIFYKTDEEVEKAALLTDKMKTL